jgi:hypothetical protein
LRGHVADHATGAEDQEQERDQEQPFRRHGQVPRRHEQGAERHRPRLAEQPITEPCPGERSDIDKPRIESKCLGGEGEVGHRPEQARQARAERGQPKHIGRDVRPEEMLCHVQHQERLHAVEGEALP